MKTVKILLAMTLFISAASVSSGKQYYRYKDPKAGLVITSTMTAEAAKFGYDIIDEKGRVIEKVEGHLEGEALEEYKKKHQAEIVEKERAKAQQEYDVNLLRRYSFVTDIAAEKKRKLAELNATVQIVKGNLAGVRSELEAEYARAAVIERQGKPIPEDLKKKISDLEDAMRSTEELYQIRSNDINKTAADYDKAESRFKELQILRGKPAQ
jgi:hypothetical protein